MHAATPRSRSHAFSTTIRRGSARSMAEPKGKRRRDRLFCPHCDEYLSNSTFYRHKEAFYNHVSGAWKKSGDVRTSDRGHLRPDLAESSGSEDEMQVLEDSEGMCRWFLPKQDLEGRTL